MISEAQVQKLRAIRTAGPSVVSLYVWVSADVAELRGLPARADELLDLAMEGMDAAQAARVRTYARRTVHRLLEARARQWLGHTAAMFASSETGLAEAFPLPCRLQDRAVVAARPHIRPLLVALQRCPAYLVAVVNRQHAWIFRVTGPRIGVTTLPPAPGVRSRGFSGWYGLESHRISQRITQLARHHFRDTAAVLRQALAASGWPPLVAGGHQDAIPAFLAVLPSDVREHFIGSFVVDPHTMTPARVRELSAPVVNSWVHAREQQLVTRVLTEPPEGRAAIGLNACLAAVNARAVAVLIVPAGGLIPGYACGLCGRLASTPAGCPHGRRASRAVPDLLDEMAAATLEEGGEVAAVRDPPAGVAALVRFALAGVSGAS
jgi:hypothetical protein